MERGSSGWHVPLRVSSTRCGSAISRASKRGCHSVWQPLTPRSPVLPSSRLAPAAGARCTSTQQCPRSSPASCSRPPTATSHAWRMLADGCWLHEHSAHTAGSARWHRHPAALWGSRVCILAKTTAVGKQKKRNREQLQSWRLRQNGSCHTAPGVSAGVGHPDRQGCCTDTMTHGFFTLAQLPRK